MKHTYTHNVQITEAFGNLLRKRHTLVLLQNIDSTYLFGKKDGFYPEGFARFIGGGLDDGEAPKEGAIREIFEETSIRISKEKCIELGKVITRASDKKGTTYQLTTFLYYVHIGDKSYQASDDISSIISLSEKEAEQLIVNMKNMTGEFVSDKGVTYWEDYGNVYHMIHKKAFQWMHML